MAASQPPSAPPNDKEDEDPLPWHRIGKILCPNQRMIPGCDCPDPLYFGGTRNICGCCGGETRGSPTRR